MAPFEHEMKIVGVLTILGVITLFMHILHSMYKHRSYDIRELKEVRWFLIDLIIDRISYSSLVGSLVRSETEGFETQYEISIPKILRKILR